MLSTLLLATVLGTATPRPPAPPDTAVAVRWTVLALDAWDAADHYRQRGRPADLPAPRTLMTALALAQNDAAPDRAAVAAASATVLAGLFPDRASAVGARLRAGLAALPDTASAERGRRAARYRLAEATRWAGAAPVPLAVGPGRWAPLPGTEPDGISIPATPLLVLSRADVFRPPTPPEIGSPAFQAALDTVRQAVRDRTAGQRRAARRWARRSASLIWAGIAADGLAQRGAGEAEAARTLAVLQAGFHDATVACFEAKYHYGFPRPSHVDPAIEPPPLVGVPNFPAYPAGHGCAAGVAETVLAWALPEAADSAQAQAHEMAESRLWAGVHYPFDNRAGVALGRAVGRAVIAAADRLAHDPDAADSCR